VSRITSFVRGLSRRRHVNRILSEVDQESLETLCIRYRDAVWSKYLDLQTYVPITVEFCQSLGLIGRQSRNILDIGCGSGLFLHCAQHFGHRGVGIDIENDLLAEMAHLFAVERRIERVSAFTPLSAEGPFDLVTAMGTMFNRPNAKADEGRWGTPEWRFFLLDLERRLSPDGRVFLRINRGKEARVRKVDFYDERVHRALGHAHRGGISYLFDRAALRRAIDNLEHG
jgi:SAM-dependent methyltransferase